MSLSFSNHNEIGASKMKHPFLLIVMAFVLGLGVGVGMQREATDDLLQRNEVRDYDCIGITHHETLDSAMEQVHKHQVKTGVLNNKTKEVK